MAACLPCLLAAANPGRKPSKLPDPGDLALLAKVMELWVEDDKTGQHVVHRFQSDWMYLGGDEAGSGPNLYWSPKLKALLIFPRKTVRWAGKVGKRNPDEYFKDAGAEKSAKLFQRWAARDPCQEGKLKLSPIQLKPYGRAIKIIYRSDKWHPGFYENYEHPFGKKVRVAVGRGTPPPMVIQGGRLTVTERGLVY